MADEGIGSDGPCWSCLQPTATELHLYGEAEFIALWRGRSLARAYECEHCGFWHLTSREGTK